MKKVFLPLMCILIGILIAAVTFTFYLNCPPNAAKSTDVPAKKRILYGQGYLRGRSMTTLKNKYASFVSKVNIYSQRKVKKGDIILEYDDFDLREKIIAKENDIAELEREVALKETQLELKKLDPLPADYRNISWKTTRAKELMSRTENEYLVYRRLHRSHSVSDLDLRSKQQAFHDAKAAYQINVSDQEKVSKGLSKLYIRQAELDVSLQKSRLESLKRELALLKEEQEYYKIIAPYDGVVKTNSDTVHAWNASGTSAASVHRTDRYYVYSYFTEDDCRYIFKNCTAKFISWENQKAYDLLCFEVARGKTIYGDTTYHLVKFRVTSPVEPNLKIESGGIIEIAI